MSDPSCPDDDKRTRIAQTLYGDGDELAWARALQLVDLVLWELGTGDIGG